MDKEQPRQLSLDEQLKKRKNRTRRARPKTLSHAERPRELNRWLSQRMFIPYHAGAQIWEQNKGAQIASRSGQRVEDVTAEMDNDAVFANIADAIDKAKKMDLSAKDVVDGIFRMTTGIANKVHDNTGWTSTYFCSVVDLVIERYHLTPGYGEQLKRDTLRAA
jgi:hypothetical protein